MRRGRQLREEPIGLKVMSQVVDLLSRTPGTLTDRSRILVAKLRDVSCS